MRRLSPARPAPALRAAGFLALLFLLGSLPGACSGGEGSELREWRPSDHQLPDGMDESDPDPATAADPGAALYATHCATCHGQDGRGGGPGAPPMARVPSLADAGFQARSDEEISQVIVAGRGGFMPAFGDRLAGPGIAAIVRHLRTFAR